MEENNLYIEQLDTKLFKYFVLQILFSIRDFQTLFIILSFQYVNGKAMQCLRLIKVKLCMLMHSFSSTRN